MGQLAGGGKSLTFLRVNSKIKAESPRKAPSKVSSLQGSFYVSQLLFQTAHKSQILGGEMPQKRRITILIRNQNFQQLLLANKVLNQTVKIAITRPSDLTPKFRFWLSINA